jgi:hypothetical protein
MDERWDEQWDDLKFKEKQRFRWDGSDEYTERIRGGSHHRIQEVG